MSNAITPITITAIVPSLTDLRLVDEPEAVGVGIVEVCSVGVVRGAELNALAGTAI